MRRGSTDRICPSLQRLFNEILIYYYRRILSLHVNGLSIMKRVYFYQQAHPQYSSLTKARPAPSLESAKPSKHP